MEEFLREKLRDRGLLTSPLAAFIKRVHEPFLFIQRYVATLSALRFERSASFSSERKRLIESTREIDIVNTVHKNLVAVL